MIYNLPPKYADCDFNNFQFDKVNIKKEDLNFNFDGFFTLIGEAGAGKTHLAVAIAKTMPKQKKKTYIGVELREPNILFLQTLDYFANINQYTAENTKMEYIRELMSYDLVILDDLGAERQTEASRQNLYYLIEKFYSYMKPMIITSNLNLKEINEIDPRIASRLAEFKIIKLKANDFRLLKKSGV